MDSLIFFWFVFSVFYAFISLWQGWQSKSGRPPNLLTEMMLPIPSLVDEKHAYRQHRFVSAQTLLSKHKRELRRPENKQIVSMVTTHSWQALFGIRSRVKKNLTGFRMLLLCPVPRVYLKPPMSMDTNLHGGREANSVTMPRLKRRLPSDVFRPK